MTNELDDDVCFDEPAEATSPATDRNAVAITQDLTRVQSALSEFDRVSAGLAELETRFPKDAVYDVSTPKGMKDAIEHRAAYRDPRVMVEKARKMAKAPILALGKNIDARAAWITERLEAGEIPVHEMIKAEEDRKRQEKADREAKEFGRVLAIQEALAGISQDVMIACGKTSADIGALLETMRTTEPAQTVFQEMLEQAKATWLAGIGKLETAHKAKLWDEEQEAARVAAEAERKARQEAEDAERARIAAEQAAEARRLKEAADKLAADQAEFARQMAELKAAQQAAQAPAVTITAMVELDDVSIVTTPAPVAMAGSPAAADPSRACAVDRVVSPPAPADTRQPITTGTLCDRLGFTVNADFIRSLGFEPAERPATAKAGTFWRAADFPRICVAIAEHCNEVAEGVVP